MYIIHMHINYLCLGQIENPFNKAMSSWLNCLLAVGFALVHLF